MKINGLMIDCSRLLEPKAYYHRLLDFMSDWGMNTLLLHFSDDHGLSLKIRGFGELAVPNAFTAADLAALLEHAKSCGIDVIPELETFGHSRYITDNPKYRHLFAGRWKRKLTFNAIDPLHKDTRSLMRRLIREVAKMFPSEYLHLGCDEVDLSEYCRLHHLPDADVVWADYVNLMIGMTRQVGKTPIIWADHVIKSEAIAERLRKDVVLANWRYWEVKNPDGLAKMKRFGFDSYIVAPSIACYRYRFFPPREGFENVDDLLAVGRKNKAIGLINTVWLPTRYLQNAMYYGIAYGASAVSKGSPPNMKEFNRNFSRKVFGTRLAAPLASFLGAWSEMGIEPGLLAKVLEKKPALDSKQGRHLLKVRRMGNQALLAAADYTPETNPEIWQAMILSAKCAWLCAESALLRQDKTFPGKRKAAYNQLLREVRREMLAEWDRTRDPEDPRKLKPRFPNESPEHGMALIRKLPFLAED